MQIWNNLRGNTHVLSTLFADKCYPKKPSRTRRINGLVAPPNSGNRHGVRLTAYYKVCCFKKFVLCLTSYTSNFGGLILGKWSVVEVYIINDL